MKSWFVIAFLITTATVALGQIPVDSIKAIIKQEVSNKRSKSIIVGIVDAGGRRIFAEGRLSDEDPNPPDGNTMYEIGSITKVFTSLVCADMSLKHQLDLNDPVSRFLPKTVRTPVKNGREISLRSLLTHRSGMPRFPYNVDPKNLDNPYADYSVSQLYEYVSNFEPAYDIDSKWKYSNIGYGLLGNILTTVAHEDFETLVDREICRPLNMNSTVITLTARLRSNVAQGYSECGDPAGFTDLSALEAAGALRSNVNDLLTFAAANMGLVKTDLLPAMELTHVPQARKDGNDTYTTLGWTLTNDHGKVLLFKDGGTSGYRTFLGIDKNNGIGVVVLSNSNNSVTDIGWHILDSAHKIEPYGYPWHLLDTLRTSVRVDGADSAIALYRRLKASNGTSFVFDEHQLDYLGSELVRGKKFADAVKIYELNSKEYPKSTHGYESIGEVYRRSGDKETAIKYFEKALELEPENPRWAFLIDKLKTTNH